MASFLKDLYINPDVGYAWPVPSRFYIDPGAFALEREPGCVARAPSPAKNVGRYQRSPERNTRSLDYAVRFASEPSRSARDDREMGDDRAVGDDRAGG